jgi:hypothetical protein
MIREIQNLKVKSVLGTERVEAILTAQKKQTKEQADKDLVTWAEQYVLRPLVLSTMALALRRLPVELLPEGIVQTQIVGTLKEKLVANENTRKELINSLDRDADIGYTELQEQMAVLDGASASERYVGGPKANDEIKGFGF